MSDSPAIPAERTTAQESPGPRPYPPGAYPRAIIRVLGGSDEPLTVRQIQEGVAVELPANRHAELENDLEALVREGSIEPLPADRGFRLSEAGRQRYEGMIALAAE